jgi:hypothetical protein
LPNLVIIISLSEFYRRKISHLPACTLLGTGSYKLEWKRKYPVSNLLLSARAEGQRFILKDVPTSEFKYLQGLQSNLVGCPYLRLAQDTVPGESVFVYNYFSDDLLNLVQRDLSIATTTQIFKDALRGLAALHGQNIVHAGKLGLVYRCGYLKQIAHML